MAELILTDTEERVRKLKAHLEKEHPSTKGKMKIRVDLPKKVGFGKALKEQLKNIGQVSKKVFGNMKDIDIKDVGF